MKEGDQLTSVSTNMLCGLVLQIMYGTVAEAASLAEPAEKKGLVQNTALSGRWFDGPAYILEDVGDIDLGVVGGLMAAARDVCLSRLDGGGGRFDESTWSDEFGETGRGRFVRSG